jgi:dihydroorotase
MKILIKNGRVIDPASNFDQVCDVAWQQAACLAIKNIVSSFAPNKVIDATGLHRHARPRGFGRPLREAGPRA